MKNESIARRLRIRHGISVSALAHAAGISKSRLVFMEGEESPRTEYQRKMLQRAYENLITERRNASDRLEHDYLRVKEHLCEIEDIGALSAGHKGTPNSLKSAEDVHTELRGFKGITAREKNIFTEQNSIQIIGIEREIAHEVEYARDGCPARKSRKTGNNAFASLISLSGLLERFSTDISLWAALKFSSSRAMWRIMPRPLVSIPAFCA